MTTANTTTPKESRIAELRLEAEDLLAKMQKELEGAEKALTNKDMYRFKRHMDLVNHHQEAYYQRQRIIMELSQ